MTMPRMTYYARVIDNISGEEVLGFTDAARNNTWYYGKCNGLSGGESEFVVEFDIWNNEPAFEAHTGDIIVADANNCKLTVWGDENCAPVNTALFNLRTIATGNKYIPFMYVRCDTHGYNGDFKGIKNYDMLTNITGNVRPNDIGIIHGNGDHTRIQTKIILPENSNLVDQRYSFVFAFYYDYEE